ncbi:tRNA ligase subunit PheS family protein [Nocardia cyriacigeorgica]|uniref:tRNA ligase subunit PheS family protein n=1 Tax=Nocardia cyriacigeorgica TaxID=135487 RepID=UPI001893A264|nr:hypothetical protein [Nocardia cyriacigeorgica]MBF6201891.1 hypothetical protein [Nocardia cyriacigeorgica]
MGFTDQLCRALNLRDPTDSAQGRVDCRQIEVLHEGEWLEHAEFGRIDPEVVRGPGLDPEQWSGLALGMGLDRALTLREAVPDIPYLLAVDPAYRLTPDRRQPSTSWCWS